MSPAARDLHHRFSAGGAKWQVSTNGGTSAKWRRDGKELFFLDPSDKIVAVDVNTSGNAVRLGFPTTCFRRLASSASTDRSM